MSTDDPILLPECFFLQDHHGFYLRVDTNLDYQLTLSAEDYEPDLSCAFKAVPNGDAEFCICSLLTGNYWNVWQIGPGSANTIACSGQFGDASFSFVYTGKDCIYLHCDEWYISDKQRKPIDGKTGGLLAYDYIYRIRSRFLVSEAVLKTEITDVVYDIPSADISTAPPTVALITTVRNDTSTDNLTEILGYTYTRSTVGTWNNTLGVTIGTTFTFKAGVPFTTSAATQVSVSGNYTHSFGGSETVTETVTSSTSIQVPALQKGKVLVLVRNAKLNINFTYTEKKWFLDGTTSSTSKHGVYKNVDSYTVDVKAGDWETVTSSVSID